MRLNQYIAKAGFASRRGADCLIKEGKVMINGEKACSLSYRVKDGDKVKVNGQCVGLQENAYILFNKPKGVTTTLKDKFADKKIIDFFPSSKERIYPIGRLDRESSGLIILTNDGDLCFKLTHPKFSIEKEYLLNLRGLLTLGDCQKAKKGLKYHDDYLKADSIKILQKKDGMTLCKVVIHEGKKRHLRRLFKMLGFKTEELKRIRIGDLNLGRLPEGEGKKIDKDKIYSLFFKRIKVVFLDRDGVINKYPGDGKYVRNYREFALIPGSIAAIRKFKLAGFKIFVISNQSGVAKGLYTSKDLERINKKMQTEFKKHNIDIDGIYYCTHNPQDNCDCRKPKIGLLKKAVSNLGKLPEESFFIGDSAIDIETAHKFGAEPILVLSGKEKTSTNIKPKPDFVFSNLLEAADYLCKKYD